MTDAKQSARRLTRCRTGCDEGKPRCRNCIDRNFECQYGPQLTFLTKNAQTVQPSEVGSLSANYEVIRDPENAKDELDDGEDEPSLQAEEPQTQPPHEDPPDSDVGRPAEPETLSELPIWSADEPSRVPTPQPTIAMFSDKDESAVAGLLALGTSTTETMAPDLNLSEFTISPPAREPSLAQTVTPINFPDYSVTFSPGHLPQPAPLNPEMSPTETLELLRHYRYEVAPWVCFLKWFQGLQQRLTRNYLKDLGAALAADTSLQVPIPPSPPYFAEGDLGSDPFGLVFSYAHRPLWLCARAIEFMHNEDPSPHLPPLHAWMGIVEELEQWYRERPQGFQPMLEIETDDQAADPSQSFSVVLFANGAGVFSNQLYHTAMLLLLHSRPRTAHIADIRSATMSPLWHAQRICSIALNNERRECWDPCLLASFLTAARRMTHESQQQEILRGFGRIRKITGWNAGELLRDLQVEWGWPEA
ncbi:uncharacterized protein N7496_008960 [Penicillium cataractarum]|uniref:Zn(2)-C6 fungal-type domain-containing protein n=1 Tax=Penicillium cataractarum TaxID=2100454 RepID=A0A9W9RZL7_9EURO|nr:uncharacterized protein N7496_008960 [Penicillium cataractarum]KAJ5369200.1 hypothetical protein N7496_008960 [Penicillium cataractarum]